MTAADAMIDAALTIRVWQRAKLTPHAIAKQLGCKADWDDIESWIVVSLLMRVDVPEPARRAA